MIEHVPPREDRREVEVPVVEVTVLEDRAVVKRRGTVALEAGANRLRIGGVAPVLQDVSLRAEASAGRVADARVRRAMRVKREDRPAEVAALEARLRELSERFQEQSERRERAEERLQGIADMLGKGADEIPDDAAWGIVDPEVWSQTFGSLFTRARELQVSALAAYHAQIDLKRDVDQVAQQRAVLDTASNDFVAWAELDVVAETAGDVELVVEYTVPNALWRPLHRARLAGTTLAFTARAAIWQNTGEDWADVQLVLSTARSSLGTEPPLLTDDLLEARKRSDEVVVEAREVSVQKASVGGAAPPSDSVELPGVDDGGEVQNLRPDGRCTVPSTGAPVFVDVFGFSGAAEVGLVSMPEAVPRVFLRCVGTHGGKAPLLAGPVELVRDSGTIGWTDLLFVAPGDRFELGFGPEDAVRVARTHRVVSEKQDPVDKWTRRLVQVELYVSNLGDEARAVRFTERVPVSEIEHVRIGLVDERTTGAPEPDANGFVTWDLSLAPHAHERVRLGWEMALAPDVSGLSR
ncbi:MAG: mucoidy inhibitor MuiA family protein [Myxococcota bacterium]